MLKDIQQNFTRLEDSMQGLPPTAFNLTKAQAILYEVGLSWRAFEQEINTSIQEQGAFSCLSLEDDAEQATNPQKKSSSVTKFADQDTKEYSLDLSKSVPITTYEQLRED